MSRHNLKTWVICLAILFVALVVKDFFQTRSRVPYYIDGKHVVMIDYNATDEDWKDAYTEWKRMRMAETEIRK